jgi:glutamate dehydrogenase
VSNDEQEGLQGSSAIEEVAALLTADPDGSPVLPVFARAYLRRLPEEELASVPVDQVAAEVRLAFAMVDGRRGEEVVLSIHDPALETDGYSTEGTVIDFVTDDTPFLVDSVMATLTRHGLPVAMFLHPVIGTVRDESGRLAAIVPAREASRRESVQHYELDRRLTGEESAALDAELRRVL